MALVRRQAINFEIFDDQSPTLWNSFVGNWSRYDLEGFNNDTVTATATPGASLSFSFSGSQAWLYGGLLNSTGTMGGNISYPTADYEVDGFSAGSQTPWFDETGAVVYFRTPQLADTTHKIDITVTTANETNAFILDFFLIVPSAGGVHSGIGTSRSVPAPSSTSSVPIVTSQATNVGAIVGGVVGGIAGIAILIFALWFFLRKRSSGGRAYYFDKPTAGDMLAGEDRVEPFDATPASPPPSSAGFSGGGPQSAYSDSSSQPLNQSLAQRVTSTVPSQYSQSGPSEAGVTHFSGTSTQPRVGKAALIAQQQDAQQPVQFQDSGIRFNENGEQEVGPSQLPAEVPPTYTPN